MQINLKMKKQFIFKLMILGIIALFAFNNASAQSDTTKLTTKEVYEDVKSLAPHIESAVSSLATGLKTTVTNVWDILVRQQLVYSIVFLVLTLASLINWYIFTKNNINFKEPKYEKVIKKKPMDLPKAGYTMAEVKDYNNRQQCRLVEEEVLELVPNSTITWFKYIHLMICLILSYFSFIHFSAMITGFINPEYGAIEQITKLALSLK